jgi:hypothetical protein
MKKELREKAIALRKDKKAWTPASAGATRIAKFAIAH